MWTEAVIIATGTVTMVTTDCLVTRGETKMADHKMADLRLGGAQWRYPVGGVEAYSPAPPYVGVGRRNNFWRWVLISNYFLLS